MNYLKVRLTSVRIFGWLLWRDIIVLKANLPNRVIDAAIWSINNIIISTFILPAFGITSQFGLLIWVGTIVTMAYFEGGYAAQELVADRAGNYHIGYLLTLPIPAWLLFVKIGCGIALNCMVLSFFMIPVGKLILGSKIDLSALHIGRFILIFLAINLFCGFFGVWTFSWAKSSTRFSEVWRRVFNPLWTFGGYQFTWFVLYNTFPTLAFLTLLNPLTYAFEGLRSAMLGSAPFLPFWFSLSMLLAWSLALLWWSVLWLKKLLDYV
jgi:hypothetical protein